MNKIPDSNKGLALLIVIFAMMLFSLLAWSMGQIGSNESDANARLFESERALSIAEAGAHWAMMRYAVDPDNAMVTDVIHNFASGQYKVTCRAPISGEGGNAVIISTGYVPSADNYRAMRVVKIEVVLQPFLQAACIKHLFDWHAMHEGSLIDGDMTVVDVLTDTTDGYEGNGNSLHNEEVDLAVPGDGDRVRVPNASGFPTINLDYYVDNAWARWNPSAGTSATITAVSTTGTRLRITVSTSLFPLIPPGPLWELSWTAVAVRNARDDAVSLAAKWAERNWGVIYSRNSSSSVTLEFDSSIDIRDAANIWHTGDRIYLVKCFEGNHLLQNLWYVDGDVLFDMRSEKANFYKTSVVAEGDIVIKGSNSLSMSAFKTTAPWFETYPNIATQNGHILSFDTPEGGSDSARINKRNFDGLIYTQNGNIFFNYLDGVAVMGNNVTFDGLVQLEFDKKGQKYIESNGGFISDAEHSVWREQ